MKDVTGTRATVKNEYMKLIIDKKYQNTSRSTFIAREQTYFFWNMVRHAILLRPICWVWKATFSHG
jgi:hypothetical protein